MKTLSHIPSLALLLCAVALAQGPTVNFVTRLGPAATSKDQMNFLVGFSEPVTGVDSSDFAAFTSIPGVVVSGCDNAALDFRFGGVRPSRAYCTNLAGTLSTEVTVEFWIFTNDAGGTLFDYALSGAATDEISVRHANNNLEFRINGALLVTSTTTINDQVWHHIAFTWDSTTGNARVLIDGVLDMTGNGQAGHLLSAGGAVSLGHHLSNANAVPGFVSQDNLYGLYDDLRIWSVVRTNSQISNARLRPRDGTETGLVLCWSGDLAEDLGLGAAGINDMRDLSPNGNHAQFGNPVNPQFVAGPAMDGLRYRVTLQNNGPHVCSSTIGLAVLNDGSIRRASDGVTPLAAGFTAGDVYDWVSPYSAAVRPGTGDDLALDPMLVNGAASQCITAGDHLAIHFGSTGGTLDWSVPLLVMQAYPFGAFPGSSLPGVQVNFAVAPLPFFLLDGTLSIPGFGPLLLPPGGLTLGATFPAGLAGLSFTMQGAVISPLAANAIYATTQAREMFVY